MSRRKKSKTPSVLRNGRPPRIRRGLPPTTSERCPDCELEGNLDIVGRPKKLGRIPFRGSSVTKWRADATRGCETCGGSGRIEVLRRNDYDTGLGKGTF